MAFEKFRDRLARILAPKTGRISQPRRDDLDPHWASDIAPEKIVKQIRDAIEGDPVELIDTFDRLRRTDLVLGAVLKTRTRAFQSLDWEIVSATEIPGSRASDESRAQAAQDYCYQQLLDCKGFEDHLRNQADAIHYGITASELVWKPLGVGHTIAEFIPLPHKSLWGDPTYQWRVRFPTSEYDYIGQYLDDFPGKFVVHRPEPVGNSPWGGGLMIATCLHAGLKHHGLRWLAAFCEGYGTPLVMASYGQGSTGDGKTETALNNLLKTARINRYGVFPQDTVITMLESMKSGDQLPQKVMMELIDKYFAIGVLGQELTTQTSSVGGGAYALGDVHDRVRRDIRDADIEAEETTIREQILKPLIEKSELRGAPVPYFKRKAPDPKDRSLEADVIDKAVNRLGMRITNAEAYDRLDIPVPDGVDPNEFLEGSADPFGGFGGGGNPFDALAATALKKKR